MSYLFIANTDKSIPVDLDTITATLAAGEAMTIQQNEAPGLVKDIQFPKATDVKHIGFWLHGAPARNLEKLSSYLNGDAHAQSKIEWFDGNKFHLVF